MEDSETIYQSKNGRAVIVAPDKCAQRMSEKEKKHEGHPYLFQTADEFRAAVDAYFEWADNNPVRVLQRDKLKGGEKPTERVKTDESVPRPYTLFELAWKIGVNSWRNFRRDNSEREGFAEVFDYAENRVACSQVVGGLVGQYNANIVARLNALAEHVAEIQAPPSTIEIVFSKDDEE